MGATTTAADHSRPADAGRRAAPWLLVGAYLLASALTVWFGVRSHALFAGPDTALLAWLASDLGAIVGFLAWVLVGALLIARRPRNTVGWLLATSGTLVGLARLAERYADVAIGGGASTAVASGAALASPGLLLAGYLLGVVILPLRYPDGDLPSPRWRAVGWLAAGWIACSAAANALRPDLRNTASALGGDQVVTYDVANPLPVAWAEPFTAAVAAVAPVVLVGLLVAVATAVTLRFRRSTGARREQMKWFASAVAMMATLAALALVSTVVLDLATWGDVAVIALLGTILPAYPLAVGVAVLRHRLYDIDRIISRTVAYGLLIAALGGVYALAIVSLGAAATAVAGAGDSDLVVAASTLLVAGLFRPVRTRIQAAVDQRFNRTGYEARQTVEHFARDVRDEVELDPLRRQTLQVAAAAVQPTSASLWIADEGNTP